MPKVKLFNTDIAINKATELFWEKGYEATSLNDLTEHLGIGKGSFYAAFKSKKQLFNLCIEKYIETNSPALEQVLNEEENFKISLQKLLEGYVEEMTNDKKRKGCFVANSCALQYAENLNIEEKIQRHYEQIQEFLISGMEKDGIDSGKARSLSAMIVTFLIGVSQQSKINRDKSSYISTIKFIVSLLG